ncbi:hypothetical protein B0H14DRAFT_3510210 [Mycena olivaceomarginata]|nr:hypothetical protein B0H14DRAFT_3510210 [Mycena olivaceomarginata]
MGILILSSLRIPPLVSVPCAELKVALTNTTNNDVSFLPMKTQWSSAAAKLKGDMLTSSDMENRKHWSVSMTYMFPNYGSIISEFWSMWRVQTSGASDEGRETVMLEKKDNIDQRACPHSAIEGMEFTIDRGDEHNIE